MDCEMVGVGQGNKSALGHVTLVNRWGNVVYDEFVRPVECVVDFRTKRLTFICIYVECRCSSLGLLLSHPKEDIRDTLEYEPFMRGKGPEGHFGVLQLSFLTSRSKMESTALLKGWDKYHFPIKSLNWCRCYHAKLMYWKQKQKKCKPKRKRAKGDELETDDAETES
ncbi:RNA exonuclease 4 [Pyrus ussuriensis x Pyrus communis]|uniref:RNA exonuclease 4 n=1 Tax=Pyrus ussuriensis x Pyrus communis TaxID=2448454 RepID=A0A5N5IQ88_9ROSA|nr:RNA exonuclease 4 [Pyrus ussuriensis x Pyrus communis]